MNRTLGITGLLALALAAAACSDKPQTAGAGKKDAEPWAGGGAAAYAAPGWKAGDQGSWESQMHARAQAQNEYNRVPAARP